MPLHILPFPLPSTDPATVERGTMKPDFNGQNALVTGGSLSRPPAE
jgi:hypothetical protein